MKEEEEAAFIEKALAQVERVEAAMAEAKRRSEKNERVTRIVEAFGAIDRLQKEKEKKRNALLTRVASIPDIDGYLPSR